MVTEARKQELIDWLTDGDSDLEGHAFQEYVAKNFGEFTIAELDECGKRAREIGEQLEKEAAELERFMPLFEGKGSGSDLLIDVARRKAAAGDALAIEFLQWTEEEV